MINCLSELIHESRLDEIQLSDLDRMEMTMYRICHRHPITGDESLPPAYESLQQFVEDEGSSVPERQHLSLRLAQITKERARTLLEEAPAERESFTECGILVRESDFSVHTSYMSYTFRTLQDITSRFDVVWPRGPAR